MLLETSVKLPVIAEVNVTAQPNQTTTKMQSAQVVADEHSTKHYI
jgi:hypothetical protein